MKTLVWIIAVVAVVIVAIGVYVVMNSGALLERAIETYGSRYLGARVEVSGVDVSLREGSATISGLVVGNPSGFSGPPAMVLDRINVALDAGQISSELIELTDVSIDGARVTALARGAQTNLQALMDNLKTNTASDKAEETESEVKLIVDRLDFTNAHAAVQSDVLGQTSVDIPDVHLTDIGRRTNGASVGQVLEQVLAPVVRAVTRKLLQQGVNLDDAGEKLQQSARERADKTLQGGLDRLRDALGPKDNGQPQEQQ